jgi:hypothetical protein
MTPVLHAIRSFSMPEIPLVVKQYNQAVENNTWTCSREVCPRCFFSARFAKHDCARRKFRVRLYDPTLDDIVIAVFDSWRVRFCCSHCGKTFTEYPSFAVPHKRFVQQDVLAKALPYLQDEQSEQAPQNQQAPPRTYRAAVRERRLPASYIQDTHGRQLSHTTVWRWLSWLGSLRKLVQRATGMILEKNASADVHRQTFPIACHKYRSDSRRQTLQEAARLFHVVDIFSLTFGRSLFTHLGTAGAPG